MSHIKREKWPQAFAEGLAMSNMLLELNRELKQYTKTSAATIPTDRELHLSAAIQVFTSYRFACEAEKTSRAVFFEKLEKFISEDILTMEHGAQVAKASRIISTVRRLKEKDYESVFLKMWIPVERFLDKATTLEFWDLEENKGKHPSEVIKQLAQEIERASKGEKDGK